MACSTGSEVAEGTQDGWRRVLRRKEALEKDTQFELLNIFLRTHLRHGYAVVSARSCTAEDMAGVAQVGRFPRHKQDKQWAGARKQGLGA